MSYETNRNGGKMSDAQVIDVLGDAVRTGRMRRIHAEEIISMMPDAYLDDGYMYTSAEFGEHDVEVYWTHIVDHEAYDDAELDNAFDWSRFGLYIGNDDIEVVDD